MPQPPKKIIFLYISLDSGFWDFFYAPFFARSFSLFVYSPSSERRKTENTNKSETLKIASRTSRQQCLRFKLGEGLRVKRTKNAAKSVRKIECLWVQVLEVRVEANSFPIPSLRKSILGFVLPVRQKKTLTLETHNRWRPSSLDCLHCDVTTRSRSSKKNNSLFWN